MEIGRKVGTQHKLLESLLAALGQAVADGGGERVADKLLSLRRALEAHFLLEEEHYFPATRRAHPDRAADLDRLTEEHQTMRAALEGLEALVDGAAWGGAARAFDQLDADFRSHEDLEAKVLES